MIIKFDSSFHYQILILCFVLLLSVDTFQLMPRLGKGCNLFKACLGLNVFCDETEYICRCDESHPIAIGGKCFTKLELGSSCKFSQHCDQSVKNSFCSTVDSQCKCAENYFEEEEENACVKRIRPYSTPDMKMFLVVMVVGLLIVSVFVYFGIAKFCDRLHNANNNSAQNAGNREDMPFSENNCSPVTDSLPPSYTQAVIHPIINIGTEADDAPPPSYEDAIKDNKDIPMSS